jgi:hypothetical protein
VIALPCPCCGKPLDEFESRTDEHTAAGAVRVLIYVHDDHSRCQIRVPAARAPAPARGRAPARS